MFDFDTGRSRTSQGNQAQAGSHGKVLDGAWQEGHVVRDLWEQSADGWRAAVLPPTNGPSTSPAAAVSTTSEEAPRRLRFHSSDRQVSNPGPLTGKCGVFLLITTPLGCDTHPEPVEPLYGAEGASFQKLIAGPSGLQQWPWHIQCEDHICLDIYTTLVGGRIVLMARNSGVSWVNIRHGIVF